MSLLSALYVDPHLLICSSLLEAALHPGSLVAYMMGDHRGDEGRIVRRRRHLHAACLGFAYVYLVCQTWYLGSFVGTSRPGEPRTFIELLFLSFTNLSAAGLGDILPITSLARILVMLEQFAGVAYIAVVVSRLIGLTIVHRDRKDRR